MDNLYLFKINPVILHLSYNFLLIEIYHRSKSKINSKINTLENLQSERKHF